MELIQNSIWELKKIDGIAPSLYRLLQVIDDISCLILFDISNSKGLVRPVVIETERFQQGIKSGAIVEGRYTLPPHLNFNEEELDKNHLRLRDENFDLLNDLIVKPMFLFDYATRKRLPDLAKHARKRNKSRTTLARLLNTYWRYGQEKNALLPAYQYSGGAGQQRKSPSKALGSPKTSRTLAIKRARTFILTDLDKDNIRKAILKHHLKPHGKNLVETRKELLRTYYSDEIKRAEAIGEAPYVPSYKQVASWKHKLFSIDQISRKSTTERDYYLNKRGLLGSAREKWSVPGSCFEIDATVADVHIVSSFGKQYVLGRPTVYSVVDRASGMVVGLNVSLYHASWRAARQALANAFLPKSSYCKEFGIDILDSDWPAAHIPLRLMCDNGEMIGLQPQKLVVPLTELQLSPPYCPVFKAMVERRFGLLNNEVIHKLQGTTRGGKVIRGDKDPRKDAIYTLKEFTALLIDATLELNRSIYTALATTSPLLINKDLSPTPLNFWKAHVLEHKHALKLADSNQIINQLYPPAKVSMTRDGIEYNNMFYSCDHVIKENLASRARLHGQWQLDARINENTTNYIYVRFDKRGDFIKCNLLGKSNMLKDNPMHESEFILDWLDRSRETRPISSESIDSKVVRANIGKEARARAGNDDLTPNEKIKDIRRHRKAEIIETANRNLENSTSTIDKPDNTVAAVSRVVYLPRRPSQDT